MSYDKKPKSQCYVMNGTQKCFKSEIQEEIGAMSSVYTNIIIQSMQEWIYYNVLLFYGGVGRGTVQERPFQCDLCSAAFARKPYLDIHQVCIILIKSVSQNNNFDTNWCNDYIPSFICFTTHPHTTHTHTNTRIHTSMLISEDAYWRKVLCGHQYVDRSI